MNKTLKGILFGALAGVVDVTPMILQKLSWDANISAFSMWVIIGFLLTRVEINVPGYLKGIIVSFLVLIPTAVIIGWQEPLSLIPISVMTIILGSVLGIVNQKLIN